MAPHYSPMKHRPALPDDSVNVSRIHPLREALWLSAGLLLISLGVFFFTGIGVDFITSRLPEDTGRGLRPQMIEALGSEFGERLTDERAARAQQLFERLLVASGREADEIELVVFDNPLVNALAAPGGVIAIFSGLLDEIESQNELAMVLGHEIGHLQNRDNLRQLGRRLVTGALAALVLGDTGRLDSQLLMTPTIALQFRYSREREAAADRIGIELLCTLYGHSGGAEDFFARHMDESGRFVFFASHPASRERVEDIARARGEFACVDGEVVSF